MCCKASISMNFVIVVGTGGALGRILMRHDHKHHVLHLQVYISIQVHCILILGFYKISFSWDIKVGISFSNIKSDQYYSHVCHTTLLLLEIIKHNRNHNHVMCLQNQQINELSWSVRKRIAKKVEMAIPITTRIRVVGLVTIIMAHFCI